eukprot:TRINITY_DN5754_c0_g1_i1.p1 TRINITY_DN5754_c0_g1~~TRINITY_DN5754_c0_g1_i1.p1  ORF type:complete len:125 (+),score=8.82 TRINITY_DN5754_c0_g1_i1:103-477(+)
MARNGRTPLLLVVLVLEICFQTAGVRKMKPKSAQAPRAEPANSLADLYEVVRSSGRVALAEMQRSKDHLTARATGAEIGSVGKLVLICMLGVGLVLLCIACCCMSMTETSSADDCDYSSSSSSD